MAILLVLAFHAAPSQVPGGFLGVDVFFVISGYLITSIIATQSGDGGFSIATFYRHRVRRIVPALSLVLAVCLAAGWWVLLKDEFHRLARHVLTTTLFVVNHQLLAESGYFHTVSRLKPLLHLWSIAVEGQFYIFWPLAARMILRRGWSLRLLALLVGVLSLLLMIAARRLAPDAGFYLLPFRLWEFMLGAGLAAHEAERRRPTPSPNLLATVGALLLLVAPLLVHYRQQAPIAAMPLATLGAALLIGGGGQSVIGRRVLSWRPLVYLGKISYPLYLWHWPALAFAQIVRDPETVPVEGRLAALALALAAAALSYHFVEKPWRQGRAFRIAVPSLVGALAGLSLMGMAAQFIPPRNDGPDIDMLEAARRDSYFPDGLKWTKPLWLLGDEKADRTLFIGDSHIEQFAPRLIADYQENSGRGRAIAFLSAGACAPVPELRAPPSVACEKIRKAMRREVNDPRTKAIVVGAAWISYYLNNRPEKALSAAPRPIPHLEDFLKSLPADRDIYLIGDTPSGPAFSPLARLEGNRLTSLRVRPTPSPVRIDPSQAALNRQLAELAERLHIHFLDPVPMLCGDGVCQVADTAGWPIFKDTNHLRPFFIRERAGFIDQTLR